MDILAQFLNVAALGAVAFILKACGNGFRTEFRQSVGQVLDKLERPDVNWETFATRFVELESKVELLPSLWDSHYEKQRALEERLRKRKSRANGRQAEPEPSDGDDEAEEGGQGVLPLSGAEDPLPPLSEEDEWAAMSREFFMSRLK